MIRRRELMTSRLPGRGVTTLKSSKYSAIQFFHLSWLVFEDMLRLGTSHRNTFPSRKIHGPFMFNPSASQIPLSDMDATWTAGGISSASRFVNERSLFTEVIWICRAPRLRRGELHGGNRYEMWGVTDCTPAGVESNRERWRRRNMPAEKNIFSSNCYNSL